MIRKVIARDKFTWKTVCGTKLLGKISKTSNVVLVRSKMRARGFWFPGLGAALSILKKVSRG